MSLVLLCLWLLWTAWTSVWITTSAGPGAELYGAGWVILTLWPPLLLVSGLGEDLVTDNLLLHWTTLFGLVLGLRGAILRSAMAGRIVHLSATAGLGGGPAYITAVARHQVHHATEVRVVCSDEKPYVDIWREMGVRVTVLPMRRPNARTIWTIVGLMLRDPAPVHAHGRGAAFFAFWIKMCVRVPVVYTPRPALCLYARMAIRTGLVRRIPVSNRLRCGPLCVLRRAGSCRVVAASHAKLAGGALRYDF